jgi:hypothetical protein
MSSQLPGGASASPPRIHSRGITLNTAVDVKDYFGPRQRFPAHGPVCPEAVIPFGTPSRISRPLHSPPHHVSLYVSFYPNRAAKSRKKTHKGTRTGIAKSAKSAWDLSFQGTRKTMSPASHAGDSGWISRAYPFPGGLNGTRARSLDRNGPPWTALSL